MHPFEASSSAKPPWHMRARETVIRYLRKHELASLNITIVANIVMFALHYTDLAEFRSIEPTILGNWVQHRGWSFVFLITAVWLIFCRRPPRVVWGLWVSVATFTIWGTLDLAVGLTASHPVSLLGPLMVVFVCTPVAWMAAETITEHAEAEQSNTHTLD